ncbi:hypothetical protein AAY473_040205 [Plecturocebus cupreus]
MSEGKGGSRVRKSTLEAAIGQELTWRNYGSEGFGMFGAPPRRGQVGNMAAPESRFPMGYTMLEESPFRIEDEDTSKLTEQGGGAVPLVAGSTGGDVSLGGLTGGGVFGSVVYGSVRYRSEKLKGLLKRIRGGRGCLLADTTG